MHPLFSDIKFQFRRFLSKRIILVGSLTILLFGHMTSIILRSTTTTTRPTDPTWTNISTIPASDPNRLCYQNQYAKSLTLTLPEYRILSQNWIRHKLEKERTLTQATFGFPYDHTRFDAFEIMGSCQKSCIGGDCKEDGSKIACGVNKGAMKSPCVVYSIGGHNKWAFELDILSRTPCEVHTFDCTGPIERFQKPDSDRLHFHHICLGAENKPAPHPDLVKGADISVPYGEFWTLDKIQSSLGHEQIDLFKMDIEGYEWVIFESWPELTDIRSSTSVLPMQILVEVHYRTHMNELSDVGDNDFKFSNDMIQLQNHFLKMGYVVVARNDNEYCPACTELTLVRVQCPPSPLL